MTTAQRIATIVVLGVLTAPVVALSPPDEATTPRIRDKEFEVHFQTDDAEAIRSVEVWYTLDRGKTWARYVPDPPQRRSPVMFVAPSEGLYGLFVIVSNDYGASAVPPTAGTAPQQWCFVDWHSPVVQLHVAAKEEGFESTRRVVLKWTACDAHLTNRPIDLHYMARDGGGWIPIDLQLPNSGRYDWRVPDQVGGDIVVKLSVDDRGGHVVERFSERLEIPAVIPRQQEGSRPSVRAVVPRRALANRRMFAASDAKPSPATRRADAPTPSSRPTASQPEHIRERRSPPPPRRPASRPPRRILAQADPSRSPTTVAAAVVADDPSRSELDPAATSAQADRERAKRLYRAGTYYRLRGQHGQRGDLAIAALRFQEALRADSSHADARLDLAGVLLTQGRTAEAIEAYELLLAQSQNHHGALQGLALAMVRQRQYPAAKRYLMQLVGLSPEDDEAWLNLGDVSHQMGNIRAARDYWHKAAALPGGADDVIARARRRLATYKPLPLVQP